MLARIRKSIDEKDQGFTLIELLVVMLIIGILAAIAVPVFLSQRKKAQDTATKADVTTLGKEIATYYVDADPTIKVPVDLVAGATATDSKIYTVNGVNVGRQSQGSISVPKIVFGTGATDQPGTSWCVQLSNTAGATQTWSYSATAGLQGKAC